MLLERLPRHVGSVPLFCLKGRTPLATDSILAVTLQANCRIFIMRMKLAFVSLIIAISVIYANPQVVAGDNSPPPANAALRDELLKMGTADQQYRSLLQAQFVKSPPVPNSMPSPETMALIREQQEADQANIKRLEAIVQRYAWPGKSLVGQDGSTSAFLIVQHAGLKVQEKYLPLLKEAAGKGETSPGEVAMLEDRVLTREGKKQRFGTQLHGGPETGGKIVLYPIEDEPNVDKRRASVGLGPLAEYVRQFNVEYHPPSATSAPAQMRP